MDLHQLYMYPDPDADSDQGVKSCLKVNTKIHGKMNRKYKIDSIVFTVQYGLMKNILN